MPVHVNDTLKLEVGEACARVAEVVQQHSPRARLFLLGQAGVGLAQKSGLVRIGHPREVFRSIHQGLGMRCERVGDDTSGYRYNLLLSNRSIVPIDRMNTWGPRKPDSIHAYFTAQLAVVELMLNHLCLQTPGPEVTHVRA